MADETPTVTKVGNAFDDVQKGLAWFIVIAFVILIFVWVFKPPVMAPESMAQLNQLVSTLQNILLLAVGFFFGSSKLAQNKDEAQNKAAEKLAEKLPPPTPPAIEKAWWNRLTDAERAAITTASGIDPLDAKLAAIVSSPVTMKPDPDEIAHLVLKNLLTQERATAIQA